MALMCKCVCVCVRVFLHRLGGVQRGCSISLCQSSHMSAVFNGIWQRLQVSVTFFR